MTSGGGTGTLAIAWDLDDDGQFDDGTTRRVTRAFDAGSHTVRLSATRSGQTDIETAARSQLSETYRSRAACAAPSSIASCASSTPAGSDAARPAA
jgi:hypothetical protein